MAITHKNTNIYVENPFSLKGKTTGQTSNNFTIIKSITIILVYASQLKKKISLIFLCFHTHKLSFSKATILFLFFFTMRHPPFFSLCGTLFFFFSLYLYIYVKHTSQALYKSSCHCLPLS